MMGRVIAIVGTTGVGKTKLSLEIARAVGGEVVNVDAMQMYRGLDIATAKASAEEREGVPHHLLSVMDVSKAITVHDFRDMALPVIDDILRRGKVPVLVGGTLYYMQSILWHDTLLDGEVAARQGASSAAPSAGAG